jgi:hypothetical protein
LFFSCDLSCRDVDLNTVRSSLHSLEREKENNIAQLKQLELKGKQIEHTFENQQKEVERLNREIYEYEVKQNKCASDFKHLSILYDDSLRNVERLQSDNEIVHAQKRSLTNELDEQMKLVNSLTLEDGKRVSKQLFDDMKYDLEQKLASNQQQHIQQIQNM